MTKKKKVEKVIVNGIPYEIIAKYTKAVYAQKAIKRLGTNHSYTPNPKYKPKNHHSPKFLVVKPMFQESLFS